MPPFFFSVNLMAVSIAKLVAIVLALSLLFAPRAGHAESYEEALGRFAADDFTETQTAIESIAASGHPMALRVLANESGIERNNPTHQVAITPQRRPIAVGSFESIRWGCHFVK